MKNNLKSKLATIVLMLILTISATLITFPTIGAQEPGTVNPHPYINAVPNPVQVNKPTLFHVGVVYPTPSGAGGWSGLTVEVTTPTGDTETLGPINTDTTGGTGVSYTPTEIGTYTVQTHFPETITTFSSARIGPEGTIVEDSYSEVLEVVVQEEAVAFYPGHSLPTEYWTRPIDGQIREWYTIAGHWLETGEPTSTGPTSMTAPYNENAPETAHILFRKPLAIGGLAGGTTGEHGFEQGDAYEGKFNGVVIIGGVLAYNQFDEGGDTAVVQQDVVAVDLHTGEELWRRPLVDPEGNIHRLSFGQAFYWDSYNYHGVFGYLWATSGSTWYAFDIFSGRYEYAMENVSSGTRVRGSNGEIFIYNIDKNDGWVTLWNSSRVVSNEGSWLRRSEGAILDGNDGYEWNSTIDELPDLAGSVYKVRDGIILGADFQRGTQAPDPASMWVISVDIQSGAELLWETTWALPSPLTLTVEDVSIEEDLFIVSTKETRATYGFRLSTGEEIWGPTPSRHYTDNWGHSSGNSWDIIAEGKVIAGNYGGTVWCYDAQTGEVEWTFDIEDPYTEILHNNRWRFRPSFVADGKLYIENTEHNPRDPQPRGAPILCLDLESGEELWRISYRQGEWSSTMIIGDSIVVAQNTYDQHIYAIGKGASATTVKVSPEITAHGSSAMITGTVMDISPGTEEAKIALRFPNGVAAVSDDCMTEWMQYVYNQFARPAATVGVTVTLEAIDGNGNYQYIGTTTSDSYGNYAMMYEPEVPGQCTIIATFEGSDSYYGSTATAYFGVVPAASASTPIEPDTETPDTEQPDTETPDTEQPDTETPDTEQTAETPLISTEVAIVAAVAVACVIGVAAYLGLRKRK
ncbi:MAG: hypothetical protein CW691_04885 [Candidatus Bathyarchaeum sp.]|nr:MAG: hypothetical protein CW691_04885 [Candidatus Bathyarchaeum sp.]